MLPVRAGNQTRPAVHTFDTWYAHRSAQLETYYFECMEYNSPLSVARRSGPHGMLYFLIHVLQRMVHQFWDTATLDPYVLRCAKTNGKCPPSIIALLFYLEGDQLSPNVDVVMPVT